MQTQDHSTYISRLKAEIAKPAYSGLTADQSLAKLNSSFTVSTPSTEILPTSTEIARGVLFASGAYWPAIKASAQNAADSHHLVASVVYDAITLQSTLATNNPVMHTVIDNCLNYLVGANAGLLNQATKDALMALSIPPEISVETHAPALDLAQGLDGAPNAVTADLLTEAQS